MKNYPGRGNKNDFDQIVVILDEDGYESVDALVVTSLDK